MNRQLSAERTRRAAVTEAEGERDAEINRAQGERNAAILRAEGARQAAILEAEGDREAAILKAQGFSLGMQTINEVAEGVDPKTMSLKYFDTLKDIGANPSTKYIFPLEFTSMLQSFMNNTSEKITGKNK